MYSFKACKRNDIIQLPFMYMYIYIYERTKFDAFVLYHTNVITSWYKITDDSYEKSNAFEVHSSREVNF